MYKRIIGVLLALVMVLPVTPVMASHTNNYVTVPNEHDDQGRSLEPDFATTSVMSGVLLTNKIFDPTPGDAAGAIPDSALPPPAAGHSSVLAPGCTDDIGRQPSGLCALWSTGANPQNLGGNLCQGCPLIPAQTVGVQGMAGSNAPGRFSANKGTVVRFLDNLQPLHITPPAGGVQYIELNRKLDDTGVRAALVGVAPEFATDYLILYQGMWAWYGGWQDLNGNGVIDELGPTCSALAASTCPPPDPRDEFWWYGNCFRFPSGAGVAPPRADLCRVETTQMLGWVYPGNHHTFSGGTVAGQGATAAIVPADFPMRQALCASDILIGRKISTLSDGFTGSPTPYSCPGRYEDLETFGISFYGDSVLDDQTAVTPDFVFADRTGDPNIGTRQWVAGNGFSMPFYDQSLLQSTISVAGVFSPLACASPCGPVPLQNAQYIDVDKFNSVAPVLSDLLLTTVKPAARANWIVARDQLSALDNANDAIIGNAAISRDAVKGPVDDQFFDPGRSHEPNNAGDIFPIARGTGPNSDAQHAGWYTDYSPYIAGKKAYLDGLVTRVGTTNFVVVILNNGSPVGVSCILCVAGGGVGNPIGDGTPKPVGTDKHARSLAPGSHLLGGNIGFWQDKAQVITETLYDVTCLVEATNCGGPSNLLRSYSYTVPADGWVGSIVNTTGTLRYRGYGLASCDIPAQGGVADRFFGICHPYRDGIIDNPQAYGAGFNIGEWGGACVSASFPGPPATPLKNQVVVDITPLDANGNPGTWANPTFVDVDFFNQRPDVSNLAPWQSKLVDYTGTANSIRMAGSCSSITTGGYGLNDLLIMPAGNLGQDVKTVVKAVVSVPGVGLQAVTDVDIYEGWAA